MNIKDSARIVVIGDDSASAMLELFLQDFFFYNSPMDARIDIQHTKISDVFSSGYKKLATDLHKMLYTYCVEHIESIRSLEAIIGEIAITQLGNEVSIDYSKIFMCLNDKSEIAFFEGNISDDEFIIRYRLLCAVDALVGIGNSFWALDNIKKFKIFTNEKAANILVKESHAITRSLSAFYIIKMHMELYRTNQNNAVLRNEIVSSLRKHSEEIRDIRKTNLREGIHKLLTAYKLSKVDTNYFKHRSCTLEKHIKDEVDNRRTRSGDGGKNKEYMSDLEFVIRSFMQTHECQNVEIFKELFGAQYNDTNPCAIGKRRYYIDDIDRQFYRELLSVKNKYDYTVVNSLALEKAFKAAQKSLESHHRKRK